MEAVLFEQDLEMFFFFFFSDGMLILKNSEMYVSSLLE